MRLGVSCVHDLRRFAAGIKPLDTCSRECVGTVHSVRIIEVCLETSRSLRRTKRKSCKAGGGRRRRRGPRGRLRRLARKSLARNRGDGPPFVLDETRRKGSRERERERRDERAKGERFSCHFRRELCPALDGAAEAAETAHADRVRQEIRFASFLPRTREYPEEPRRPRDS